MHHIYEGLDFLDHIVASGLEFYRIKMQYLLVFYFPHMRRIHSLNEKEAWTTKKYNWVMFDLEKLK